MSETMRLAVRIGAPIARVYRALTDARELRGWLAEHADVDLPHRYTFWGRYTPEGGSGRQTPLWVDERTVRFAWPLGGETTTVEFSLSADDENSTILALSQTHVPSYAEAVADPGARSVLATFWALALSNLVDYVTGRELTGWCDFSSGTLRAETLIAATPQRVFASLIDSDQLRQWFGANIRMEPHVGGRVTMGDVDLAESAVRVVEFEPGRRLGVNWGSLVETWELADSDGHTRLTFVQSGFDGEPPYAAWAGSLAGIGELRRFHELPDWQPTWLRFGLPETPDGLLAPS